MKLSVIIPFYNLERYVRECLDSVVAAAKRTDDVSLEVICVDDGSTDATGRILDEYAAGHNPQFSIFNFQFSILHQPNGGEGAARNAGLAAANGEWVTFLDGDDVWLPDMLHEAMRKLTAHHDADIIGFRFLPFNDGSPRPEPVAAKRAEIVFDAADGVPSKAICELGVFPTFFRKERFGSLRFSALPLGADRLYVAQCLSVANKVVMSDAGVHGYRIREGSMARAVWNARKIRSMIDFASGSLAAFVASERKVGREGSNYLMDVLTSVTAKKLANLSEGRGELVRYWLTVLAAVDHRFFTLNHRLRLRWYRLRF